jgi:UDP-2,3-diacylglucosamine pyrophosphatase LpxH
MGKFAEMSSDETGIVLSDLHLFAGRSNAEARLKALREPLTSARLIVLNGDTFDFRWSRRGDFGASSKAACQWLREWASGLPASEIHYVLGNHDCLESFTGELTELASTLPSFRWHSHRVCLGRSLFLHGDCTQREMDGEELERYRETWRRDSQRGRAAELAYKCADLLGITHVAHAWHFPAHRTIRRLAHHLDAVVPGWDGEFSDCYFGHTHRPFTGLQFRGVRFHNTGSAVRGFPFNPIWFPVTTHRSTTPTSIAAPQASLCNP